jgi:hypothetical protein
MTGLRGRWPIWGTRFPIKQSAMFCGATVCRQRRSASARPRGRPLFRTHLALLAGTDFFSAEVLTLRGLVTYYVVILFSERSLWRALNDYVEQFHAERNHQGKDNVLLFPLATDRQREGPVSCRERLGGLLRYYHREAA